VAIARVLVRAPDLVIFDEATSQLDSSTEQALQDRLTTVLAGKTVVMVAHRLSTIKEADLIYVLHHGRLLQAGTHQELLAQEGMYRTLWRLQTGEELSRLSPPAAQALPQGSNDSMVEGVAHAH
jgi:ABC-type multidrug transport system fused ATPase/permease subunit